MKMKNTLSILENIKKKINKLEEPRGSQKKNFSDLNDEFEYIDSSKNEGNYNIHKSDSDKKVDHDVMLEHEIESSFPDESLLNNEDANDEAEEHYEELHEEVHEEIQEEDDEEELPELELEHVEEHVEEVAKPQENIEEDFDIEDLASEAQPEIKKEVFEEEFENFVENEVSEKQAETAKTGDLDDSEDELFKALDEEESVANYNNVAKVEVNKNVAPVAPVAPPVRPQIVKQEVYQEEIHEDTIDLDALDVNIAKSKENKIEVGVDLRAKKEQQLTQDIDDEKDFLDDVNLDEDLDFHDDINEETHEAPIAKNNHDLSKENDELNKILAAQDEKYKELKNKENQSFDVKNNDEVDADPIKNEGLAQKVSESIKNLVEAKNMVNKVENFAKNDVLSEVAAELMKPRLEKWMNENLPELVEKIVREEIKKIIAK